MTTPAPLLALENISVNFGGLRALSDLSLRVRPGSLHGLVGPNGAGKTTAMNVISGLVRPTSGTMNYNGRPFRPKPDALAGMGVARTFQASAFIESLSACENVMFGGHSNTRSGVLACMLGLARAQSEERALRERAEAALTEVGYAGASQARAADLTTWQRRQIEIARALVSRPRLLLLDEPAAGLTAHEVEQLKALLHRLREEGGGERAVAASRPRERRGRPPRLRARGSPAQTRPLDGAIGAATGRAWRRGIGDWLRFSFRALRRRTPLASWTSRSLA